MKPIKFSTIHACILSPALAASAMVFTMTMAQAGSPAATAPAEPAVPANWITFTIGGASVSGDDANFSRRMRTDDDFYGGIRDMYYSHALNDSTTLTLDGHALPGNEDYEFNMDLEKADLGYIKAGYKQFRTWYDNSGGYSALAGNRWVQMGNDECSIDRGTLYLEAGLRMENLPEITFRYTHTKRDGNKDSLAWGDNQNNTRLKLVPSLWTIDESVDIFELDVEHTIGNTDIGLGLVYERSDYSNTRTTPRGGDNNVAVPVPAGATGYSQVALTDGAETDLFASHVYGVTRFSDTAWLSYSAAYNTSNSDINGSRTYDYGTNLGVRDYQFPSLNGGSQMDQFIANINFRWVPMPDLTVTPSIRYEHETVDVSSRFNAYSPVDLNQNAVLTNAEMFNATTIFWKGPQAYTSATEMDSTTMAVDLRYTGISDVVLYANAMAGVENETITRVVTPQPTEWLGSEAEVNEQEFKIGANWYAMSNLSFSIQGLYENRDQSLDHAIGPFTSNPNTLLPLSVQAVIAMPNGAAKTAAINALPPADLAAALAIVNAAGMANNLRPIMVSHETDLTNINLRATWRPMSNLSLVTRYDYRLTRYENQGISLSVAGAPALFAQIQSGEVASHILSESATWSPLSNLYFQGFVSWVSSETSTPMSLTTPNSDNDYLTCGLSAGYAIDSKTSLTANYSFYGSSDYSVATASMGYGMETKEHAISLTLSRVINENMIWDLSYGFVTSNTSDTDQSGGFNDFEAHMVSTGLQIRF